METDKNKALVGKACGELTFEEMVLSRRTGDLTRKPYTTVAARTSKCLPLTLEASLVVSLVAC